MDMTPHFPVYMDYGATTPVDQRVVDAMIPWLREHFGNPASRSHASVSYTHLTLPTILRV